MSGDLVQNGRAPVTPDMAMRLAAVFSTEPEVWVNLQAQNRPVGREPKGAPESEAAATSGVIGR